MRCVRSTAVLQVRERRLHDSVLNCAAVVPFMPHWLEYSLLPSDKDGLSLKPSVAGSAPASAPEASAPEAPPRRTSDPATRAPAPVPAPVVEAPPAAPPRRV